ncbi:MAG: hypothetical protein JWQ45_2858 [Blastococcus sp.]|nr:hypothetical protein [Blastococcus sp.]
MLWFLTTTTIVVLLFGYSTSTSGPAAVGGQSSAVASGDPVSGGSTSTSSTAETVTGPAVATRWGDVQVAITVDGSTITDVTVPVYPTGNGKDQRINAYALPILISDTLDAQSADIDMITGATVTSEGYVRSLQGALDRAGR